MNSINHIKNSLMTGLLMDMDLSNPDSWTDVEASAIEGTGIIDDWECRCTESGAYYQGIGKDPDPDNKTLYGKLCRDGKKALNSVKRSAMSRVILRSQDESSHT